MTIFQAKGSPLVKMKTPLVVRFSGNIIIFLLTLTMHQIVTK
jgi:hypothetical protein